MNFRGMSKERPAPRSDHTETHIVHNINGENLMELDQTMLKEIGIKKIGDRIRIANQIKKFRLEHYTVKKPVRMTS